MASLIGPAIGIGASLLGGSSAKSNDLTGYNYLTGKNGIQSYVNSGKSANTASADLLGLNGAEGSSHAAPGFNNYLNSTGYKFQRDQGGAAITGSAAARGFLNSGATAKALTSYGQNLASTSFNNYLGQLNNQSNQGLTASGQIGSAGTSGGVAAGKDMGGAIGSAGGILSGAVSNNAGGFNNFFAGI